MAYVGTTIAPLVAGLPAAWPGSVYHPKAKQIVSQLLGRGIAVRGIFLIAFETIVSRSNGIALLRRRARARFLESNLPQYLLPIMARKSRFQRQQFVQGYGQGVDVRAMVHQLTPG